MGTGASSFDRGKVARSDAHFRIVAWCCPRATASGGCPDDAELPGVGGLTSNGTRTMRASPSTSPDTGR